MAITFKPGDLIDVRPYTHLVDRSLDDPVKCLLITFDDPVEGDDIEGRVLSEGQLRDVFFRAGSFYFHPWAPLDGFVRMAFPIVRRVFPQMVANDIVSVQPMTLPDTAIFDLDYTYGDDDA